MATNQLHTTSAKDTNRDSKGRFEIGNQAAKKSGLFSNFIPEPDQDMLKLLREATLNDELDMTRVRMQMGLKLINDLNMDIGQAESEETKKVLEDILWKMDAHLDVLVFRIESMTKTISRVGSQW
jgi:hypothetical protein